MNMADSLWHEDEVRVEKTSNIFFDIEQRANNRLLLYSCLEYQRRKQDGHSKASRHEAWKQEIELRNGEVFRFQNL